MKRSLIPSLVLCVAAVAGCDRPGDRPGNDNDPVVDPVFNVRGETRGALAADVTGTLRAALSWSVYSAELVECLDGVEVDGLLDFNDDADWLVAERLELCYAFSERGQRETASVSVAPDVDSFTIPLGALPDDNLLTGADGARLGVASVMIYTDDNQSGAFEETPRGALAFSDTVHGTSLPVDEYATQASWLVYRDGEVSPLWKLYRAFYGCGDPAQGFSTMTVTIDNDLGTVSCVLDDRPVAVELLADIEFLGCAADPERHTLHRAAAQDAWPAGAEGICDNSNGFYDLYVTEQANSVCPSFRVYTLEGCSDMSSEQACISTYWSDFGNEPGWWPCAFETDVPALFVEETLHATDDNDAQLFAIRWYAGAGDLDLSRLSVVIETGNGNVTLDGAALSLVDNDQNGVLNAGDRVRVGETNNEFTTNTAPGRYLVRVLLDGAPISTQGEGAYEPVELPTFTAVELTAVDAPAAITDDIDDVAIVTYSGEGPGVAFDTLSARGYLGGEYPLAFTVVAQNDLDGDGLFEPGDSALLRDGAGDFEQATPELLAAFGGFIYLSLHAEVVENVIVDVGYANADLQ
jgi:hypothetical protein